MAKITRYTGNLLSFGANATGTNRTVFGDVTQSDTLDDNVNVDFLTGWEIITASENPTKQDFSAMGFTLGQVLAYLHQVGVAEWDVLQEYHTDSMTNRNGAVYVSLTDTNVGNDPETDTTNWKLIAESNLIDEVIVSGGAVTQIDFTGLDINKHKGYRVEIELANAIAAPFGVSLFVNNDTTSANYYRQTIVNSGASVTTTRNNDPIILSSDADDSRASLNVVRTPSGIPTVFVDIALNSGVASTIELHGTALSKTASVTNIDQLTFVASVANAFDNGTRVRIYKEDV